MVNDRAFECPLVGEECVCLAAGNTSVEVEFVFCSRLIPQAPGVPDIEWQRLGGV